MDGCTAGDVGEAHVIEHDPVVFGGELAKVIHVGDDEGVVKAVNGPLCLAGVGRSPDIQGFELVLKGECPISIAEGVGEVWASSDVVSDEFNVANSADFHSSDVNGLPQG